MRHWKWLLTHRSCVCPNPSSVQGQDGCGLGQPDLVESVPGCGRGVGAKRSSWSVPTENFA